MRLMSTLLLACLLLVPSWAVADRPHRVEPRLLVAQNNDGPSLSEAVEQVRRRHNGRIVSAETRMSGNRELHVIKVLTEDGKVITERIPGRTRGER